MVMPEGSKIELNIKKSQIAINASDARPNRFIKGDRIDSAIQELDIKKRKVNLHSVTNSHKGHHYTVAVILKLFDSDLDCALTVTSIS